MTAVRPLLQCKCHVDTTPLFGPATGETLVQIDLLGGLLGCSKRPAGVRAFGKAMIEELRVRPDITLAVDGDGVIRSAVSAERLAGEVLDPWRGLPWKDTLDSRIGQGGRTKR